MKRAKAILVCVLLLLATQNILAIDACRMCGRQYDDITLQEEPVCVYPEPDGWGSNSCNVITLFGGPRPLKYCTTGGGLCLYVVVTP